MQRYVENLCVIYGKESSDYLSVRKIIQISRKWPHSSNFYWIILLSNLLVLLPTHCVFTLLLTYIIHSWLAASEAQLLLRSAVEFDADTGQIRTSLAYLFCAPVK